MMVAMPRGGKRPGAGRPKKYGRSSLSETHLIRSTKEQGERWRRVAQSKGLEFSDWARKTLDAAAADAR